jgi:hypothetical protein
MEVARATFTIEEIEEMLAPAGYVRDTMAFVNEVDRRFQPSDTQAGHYVERDDWNAGTPSEQFVEVQNGDVDPKQIPPRRYPGVDRRFDVC